MVKELEACSNVIIQGDIFAMLNHSVSLAIFFV